MTLRSSSSDAKTRITCRTLKHLNRLSKSTCSSRESVGRLNSMTYTKTSSKTLIIKCLCFNWSIVKKKKKKVLSKGSDLISCTRQEGLHFNELPRSRERRLHQTPHERVDQGCRDPSPSLNFIQDLKQQ